MFDGFFVLGIRLVLRTYLVPRRRATVDKDAGVTRIDHGE